MKGFSSRVFLCLIAILIIAPFAIVAGVSVGASKTIAFPPAELSLGWYKVLFTDTDWLKAIGVSLLVAVSAAARTGTISVTTYNTGTWCESFLG